jgi:hypothetical protein
MCPPPLFAEIIRINHLRLRATQQHAQHHYNSETGPPDSLTHEAYSILSRINAFSPAHWAATKPRARDDWTLVGRIYHAAVALYWAAALQSVSVLMPSAALRAECAARTRLLLDLLVRGVGSPRTRQGMLWPLVVIGMGMRDVMMPSTRAAVAAAAGGQAAREGYGTSSRPSCPFLPGMGGPTCRLWRRRCWKGSGRLERRGGMRALIGRMHL